MEMRTLRLLAVAVLAFSLAAHGDFRTLVEVHEVVLVNLRLPATESGALSIKECADCDALLLRVNPSSRYVLNGQTIALADFRKAIAAVTNRQDVIVDVFHDLETNVATKVRVRL